MTDTINKRIDDLSVVVQAMDRHQTRERQEASKLMEKLVDAQTSLGKQFAEKSALDTAVADQLKVLWAKHEAQSKDINDLKVEMKVNTEARKIGQRQKNTIFSIVAGVIILGAFYSWTLFKGG